MQTDTVKKTLIVALGVCLVCSVLVSSAFVSLKGKQDENRKLDKLKNILIAGGLYSEGTDIVETYEKSIQPVVVNLKTGVEMKSEECVGLLDPTTFDIKKVAADPELGLDLTPEQDLAKIKRIPKKMILYKVVKNNEIEKYIFPIYGKGLWSTLWGFIAIDKDLHTIKGITFYEHGETPGLGGEVDNPKWKASWDGKQAFDKNGNVKIEVIKSIVNPSEKGAEYKVDGLSGATLTTRGVSNLVRFWLGKDGYGPFFRNLKGGA